MYCNKVKELFFFGTTVNGHVIYIPVCGLCTMIAIGSRKLCFQEVGCDRTDILED